MPLVLWNAGSDDDDEEEEEEGDKEGDEDVAVESTSMLPLSKKRQLRSKPVPPAVTVAKWQ